MIRMQQRHTCKSLGEKLGIWISQLIKWSKIQQCDKRQKLLSVQSLAKPVRSHTFCTRIFKSMFCFRFLGQLSRGSSKHVCYSMTDIRRVQNNEKLKVLWYRLISPRVCLMTTSQIDSQVKSFQSGQVMVAAITTALSR